MNPPTIERRHDNIRLGAIWMLVSLAGYSFNALVIGRMTMGAGHTSPWAAMVLRGLVGLITVQIIAPGVLRSGWKELFTNRLMLERGVVGTLGIASFYFTLGPLGTGKATLINNSWAVFAAVMATLTLGEKLGWLRFAGLCVALFGLSMLLGVGWDVMATVHGLELIAVIGAILSAVAVIAIRQLSATHSSAIIYSSQCVYCLLLGLPFALKDISVLSASQWGWMCGAAVAVSLAQLAMTEGFRYMTVAAGGAIQMVLPLVISALSIWLFGESFTTAQMMGALLIVGGSVVTVVKK